MRVKSFLGRIAQRLNNHVGLYAGLSAGLSVLAQAQVA
jgi:hypothetical protein